MVNIKVDKNVFRRANVKLAYLFGSRAKGASARESDFDIAVLFKRNYSPSFFLNEATRLQGALKKYIPYKTDVVTLNNAPSLLKYEVIAHGIVLYQDDPKFRIDFEVRSVKEYIDDRYMRDIYFKAMEKRVKEGIS
jgi:predicted nucleotidyltransferase